MKLSVIMWKSWVSLVLLIKCCHAGEVKEVNQCYNSHGTPLESNGQDQVCYISSKGREGRVQGVKPRSECQLEDHCCSGSLCNFDPGKEGQLKAHSDLLLKRKQSLIKNNKPSKRNRKRIKPVLKKRPKPVRPQDNRIKTFEQLRANALQNYDGSTSIGTVAVSSSDTREVDFEGRPVSGSMKKVKTKAKQAQIKAKTEKEGGKLLRSEVITGEVNEANARRRRASGT